MPYVAQPQRGSTVAAGYFADQRRESDKPGAKKQEQEQEQESLIAREERLGIRLEEEEHHHTRDNDAGDDFGMEM